MKLHLGIFFAAVTCMGAAAAAPSTSPQSDRTDTLSYRVYINPFEVKKLGLALREARQNFFPKRIGRAETVDHYGEVAYAVEQLAQRYSITVESITSAVAQSFDASLTLEQVEALKNDFGVSGVQELGNLPSVYSGTSTTNDTFSGNEVTTWAKQYVNANQPVSVANPLFLIDGGLEYYGQYDINIISQTNAGGSSGAMDHAGHVAGLIGARINGSGAVGINPGQPIKLFGMNYLADVINALDQAVRNAENSDQFAVANVSLNNNPADTANRFDHSGNRGRALRAASNRLFITQSAGNFNTDACTFAYSYPSSAGKAYRVNDGIMVVGGVNRAGARYTDTYNDFGGTSQDGSGAPLTFPGPSNRIKLEGGSNSGACVEAWAPAHEITSVVYNFTGGPNHTRVLTGTSFAAPIVAAIASRYGSISTRPIEREAYIRNSLTSTGNYASGLPINVVKYTSPSAHDIPKRLNIATSSSPTNSNNLHVLYDGKFFEPTGIWEANSNNGSIMFDLGAVKTVVGIRITVKTVLAPMEFENYPMGFAIGVGNDPSGIVETAYHTEPSQADNVPVYIDIPTVGARFVRLNASNQHWPLGFSEVEIYGY
ncbi:MAG: hypothetical protein EOP24_34650 [Hyphomicrobiales bacterium]|nr:MAG: hypothetical protein EOP24_34650 [Hyphomicrobiales bacterium]